MTAANPERERFREQILLGELPIERAADVVPEWRAFLGIFDRLDAGWQTEDVAEPEHTGLGWQPCIVEPTETQPVSAEPDLTDWILATEPESADDLSL